MQPLWRPSQNTSLGQPMIDFMAYVNAQYGCHISNYQALHQWSINNRELFWPAVWQQCRIIGDLKPPSLLPSAQMINDQWMPNCRLNYAENCLAINPGDDDKDAIVSYDKLKPTAISKSNLQKQVKQLANQLVKEGIKKGDVVAGVLPNGPEAIIAMLATASIGAIWTSCSPDFGVATLLDRLCQTEPKVLFICNGYYYNQKTIDLFQKTALIVEQLPSLKRTVIVDSLNQSNSQNSAQKTNTNEYSIWSEYFSHQSDEFRFERFEFNHPLFIMYSSGTTGKPKCIVHGSGGTLLQHAKEHRFHCGITQKSTLFFYTTCGWMMWNWLASALCQGATIVLYDQSPFYPNDDVLLTMAEQLNVTHFGVSAKYLSELQKRRHILKPNALEKVEMLLTTGSPLSPASFDYVYEQFSKNLCLSSISGGTDILSCFALGNPILNVYKGQIQCPGLGMDVDVFDEEGNSLDSNVGELVCKQSFVSMPVGFYNDHQNKRYFDSYFNKYPNVWTHGDFIERTQEQGFIIHGRSDATLNRGGVRIGTAEIYAQLEQIEWINEAVIASQHIEDDLRIVLFVTSSTITDLTDALKAQVNQQIKQQCSQRHVPDVCFLVKDIPKTNNGKTAEKTINNLLNDKTIDNKGALANPSCLEEYQAIKQSLLTV